MEWQQVPGMYGGVWFPNLTVKKLQTDQAGGRLVLHATYVEREYVTLVFEEMFYSQLDEQAAGMQITCIEEAQPSRLREHRAMMARMLADCGGDGGFVESLAALGNKMFVHHTAGAGEYLVVAKRLQVMAGWA